MMPPRNPQLICLPEFYCLLEESDSAYLSEKYCFETHPALLHGKEMAERTNCWILLGSIPVFVGQNKIKNQCGSKPFGPNSGHL